MKKNSKQKINHLLNFAEKNPRQGKKGKHSRKWIYYVAGLAVLVIIPIIIYYPTVKSAYDFALAGREDFVRAQGAIGAQDFSGAKRALVTADEKLQNSKTEIQKLKYLKFIPVLGRQINAVDNILIATIQLGNGLQDITDLGDSVFAPLKKDGGTVSLSTISPEQTKRILKTIYEAPPLLQ
jgi:hypothetical protein